MVTTSLITGITGQDGSYLARLLLAKGHRVVGVVRPGQEKLPIRGLEYLGIASRVSVVPVSLCSAEEIMDLLVSERPDEIYNLAAQSSVVRSFEAPGDTLAFNTMSVLTLLECLRKSHPAVRFYQASSGEMFGRIPTLHITEDTALNPVSPYAVSKASTHWMAKNYRDIHGLFVSCGILFNHESHLRSRNFFIKKSFARHWKWPPAEERT